MKKKKKFKTLSIKDTYKLKGGKNIIEDDVVFKSTKNEYIVIEDDLMM